MKRRKVTFMELIQKNKEELLKDKKQVAEIEERIEARIVNNQK